MHWKTLSRNLQSQATEREIVREREICLKQINRPQMGKRMNKASYNSRKKKRRLNGRSKTM